MQQSLKSYIDNGKSLSDEQIDKLVLILGAYCRPPKKRMIRFALNCVPDIPNYGIYGRVHLDGEPNYCAGQSYPDEIRTVRELLTGRK